MNFDYHINNQELSRTEQIRDLGVIFDKKLTFKSHIDKIVSSSCSTLGFIKRRAREFNDPYTTKTLYTSLVQPILEYASVIWSPYRQIDIDRIESVQKQFLIFALRPLGFTGYNLPHYTNRLLLLNMTTLENRRTISSALLAFDLLRHNIKIETLCNRINVNIPNYSLRRTRYLIEDRQFNDFTFNDIISRALRDFNKNSNHYNEAISRITFKKRLQIQYKTIFSS